MAELTLSPQTHEGALHEDIWLIDALHGDWHYESRGKQNGKRGGGDRRMFLAKCALFDQEEIPVMGCSVDC